MKCTHPSSRTIWNRTTHLHIGAMTNSMLACQVTKTQMSFRPHQKIKWGDAPCLNPPKDCTQFKVYKLFSSEFAF